MSFNYIEWLRKNKTHIWVWILFALYETVSVGLILNSWGNPLTYIIHYSVTICLFYIYANEWLPLAFKNKFNALWLVPLAVILQLILYVLLHYLADKFLIAIGIIQIKRKEYPLDSVFVFKNIYRGSFFTVFATGYYFLQNFIKERKRTADLEKAQLNAIIKQQNTEQELSKAKNAFLKAQINPHFLFNTLNFIYNKVNIAAPQAGEAILSLNEMMRYAINSDEQGEYIILKEEMEQVVNLLHLYNLRKEKELHLDLSFDENTRNLKFIPLVLLTLVENMLKHGEVHDPLHVATVKVYIERDVLYIETDNLIQYGVHRSHHTGLANVKTRLIYAYGRSIDFSYYTDDNQHFRLKLAVSIALINEIA